MSSVSSVLNPAVANLLQTLTKVKSPVLHSQAAVSALKKAPPSDIVQLSVAAARLQSMNTLFGIPSPASSRVKNIGALFGLPVPASTGAPNMLQAFHDAGAFLTPQEKSMAAQAAARSLVMQGLFGTGPANPGTFFDLLA